MASPTDRETRAAWDALACDYAALVPDMSSETPLDRAVLAAFAEALDGGEGPALVAEVGCGAGRVTRHLRDLGLRMVGFDLSPAMAAAARAADPTIPVAAAHAGALPLRSGVLDGLLAWYSLINLPTADLAGVLAEFARVLRPRAPVLVAFQSGDGRRVERAVSYGRTVPLTYYRHRTDEVAAALETAGFILYATIERAAALAFESSPQTALIALRDGR